MQSPPIKGKRERTARKRAVYAMIFDFDRRFLVSVPNMKMRDAMCVVIHGDDEAVKSREFWKPAVAVSLGISTRCRGRQHSAPQRPLQVAAPIEDQRGGCTTIELLWFDY